MTTLKTCFLLVLALSAWPAFAHPQWQPLELRFTASKSHERPATLQVDALFTAPDGRVMIMPAFWDGGERWGVRFAPTTPGTWTYQLRVSEGADPALAGSSGSFAVEPAASDNPLYRNGGFLKVAPSGRYLTYSDGTPFFWLGDTWWFCPSELCPIDESSSPKHASMFKAMVATRKAQGYSVAQMLFAGPQKPPGVLRRPQRWSEADVLFWQRMDGYVRHASEQGLLLVLGVGFSDFLDRAFPVDLRLLWRYLVARYGAYPVTWLITGEYNSENQDERVRKTDMLGRYLKQIDPYDRAMSVHPWQYGGDKRQAWSAPWLDFAMLQGAHGGYPPARIYQEAYAWQPVRPFLEDEANYEGIHEKNAEIIRTTAYRAIQSGSFGYTYGSHGLWYPIHSPEERIDHIDRWGRPLPWWEALEREGGRQMGHLRKFYESLPWWRLEPRPDAIETGAMASDPRLRVTVKADGDSLFVVHFPPGFPAQSDIRLKGMAVGEPYVTGWFDPRSGKFLKESTLRVDSPRILLPNKPDRADWVLLLRKPSTVH
ncbi:MAG: DUF5060 domain-containing protein [Sulfuricellaceae bacterium]|nr:DUF5060 domain-containing protein [Sulfuricellaceae bacterium]